MNIETVNELIASLESAGELSIREQKFLKLAKEFRICSASLDAAIKTGNMLADQNAQLAAENVALKSFGDKLNDMHNALNGEGTGIQGRAEVACQQVALEAAIEEFDAIETPATGRIVAGIKADGVEEFAAKLRIPGDDQFFDALAKGVALAADDFSKQLREGADK
ncbi:hypothetical protein ACFYK0_01875 [Klebsiella pneumoniae]|uniref:hypothetical protein n=1 Tax=Klebsiella pneumoniae TaxID=573 RepID=UPI0022DCEF63|nr:hypothetical protein [Klebsiella pneumoniae]WBN37466.1 hypothetical protein KHV96_20070 [Klebsiella pneumoniae]